jgi:tRNA threonylcarbamoyladenosine biosynthesis protein TsaE
MRSKSITTANFKDTENLGFELGSKLKNGAIFVLYGNLGSGKTTFVQGLARGLGISKKIISPTFIIVRKYQTKIKDLHSGHSAELSRSPGSGQAKSKIKNFYHIDLYRIEKETDLKGLGLEEILNDKSNIVAIEWPEKIEKLLPTGIKRIYFEYVENGLRNIKII